jgi:transcriptional antiterminator Rof (Rho-off)
VARVCYTIACDSYAAIEVALSERSLALLRFADGHTPS